MSYLARENRRSLVTILVPVEGDLLAIDWHARKGSILKKIQESREPDDENEDAGARCLHQSYRILFAPWRATQPGGRASCFATSINYPIGHSHHLGAAGPGIDCSNIRIATTAADYSEAIASRRPHRSHQGSHSSQPLISPEEISSTNLLPLAVPNAMRSKSPVPSQVFLPTSFTQVTVLVSTMSKSKA